MGALGEGYFEAADWVVGYGTECAAGDAFFADECFAVEVERYAVALEHEDEFGELRAAVRDEVDGACEGDWEDRCDCLRDGDH